MGLGVRRAVAAGVLPAALLAATAACGGGADSGTGTTTTAAASAAEGPVAAAESTLRAYLGALHERRYEDAARLYGGSYDALGGDGAGLASTDRAARFERYCTGGGRCLRVMDAALTSSTPDGRLRFAVRFAAEDGTVFSRGPCCGEPDTGMRTTSFDFTLVASGSSYVVLDLPPYAP